MKEKIRAAYEMIDQKVPFVGNLIRKFYFNRGFTNTIKKRISGKGNKIIYGHSILSTVTFDIKGDDNLIHIRDRCILNGVHFFIRGNGHQIHIGSGCRFHRGGSLWLEDDGGYLQIGAGTTFEEAHLAVTEPGSKIIIGENCMFSYDIDIRTGDSHSIIERSTGLRINVAGNINIGNHVWVAAHSIILKGVSIADDCVVGTGAVVVKSIEEPGVIVAGNPATIIKRNITWSRRRTGGLD